MDPSAFDRLARAFSQSASRRRAFGLLGGLAALAAEGATARRHHRRRPATAAPAKTTICHLTHGTTAFVQITVAASALPAHLAHGDFLYGACCTDDECGQGEVCLHGDPAHGAPSVCGVGSTEGCGPGPACPRGQVCLSGICLTTCPGAVACVVGAGGCKPPLTCMQTTAGASVCLDLSTNVPCQTDADCGQRVGLGAVCVVNPPHDPPCSNLPAFCAICGICP